MLQRCAYKVSVTGAQFLKQAETVTTVTVGQPLYASTAQRNFADQPSFPYEPDYGKKHDIVRKHGVDVLHDALYNKVQSRVHARAVASSPH